MSGLGNARGGGRGSRGRRMPRGHWSLHTESSKKPKPLEMFPRIVLQSQSFPSKYEIATVKGQIAFRERTRRSPLFMPSSEIWKPNVSKSTAAARFEPFGATPVSRRSKSRTYTLPKIRQGAYPFHLYPEELRTAIDQRYRTRSHRNDRRSLLSGNIALHDFDRQAQRTGDDLADPEENALRISEDDEEISPRRPGINSGDDIDEDDMAQDDGADHFFDSEEDDVDDVTMRGDNMGNEVVEDEYE